MREHGGTRSSRVVRGIAVLAAMLIAAGAVAPAFSAQKPVGKKKFRRVVKKLRQNDKSLQAQVDGIPVQVFGSSYTRVTPTSGPDVATAQANAPKVPLLSRGQLSVYGKCFESAGTVYGRVYIETSVPGALFSSREDDRTGGDGNQFLDPDTPEGQRELFTESASSDLAFFGNQDPRHWHAMAPDGTNLDGTSSVGVKQGSPPGGNGLFGAGNVCLFGGFGLG